MNKYIITFVSDQSPEEIEKIAIKMHPEVIHVDDRAYRIVTLVETKYVYESNAIREKWIHRDYDLDLPNIDGSFVASP